MSFLSFEVEEKQRELYGISLSLKYVRTPVGTLIFCICRDAECFSESALRLLFLDEKEKITLVVALSLSESKVKIRFLS